MPGDAFSYIISHLFLVLVLAARFVRCCICCYCLCLFLMQVFAWFLFVFCRILADYVHNVFLEIIVNCLYIYYSSPCFEDDVEWFLVSLFLYFGFCCCSQSPFPSSRHCMFDFSLPCLAAILFS